MMFPIIVPTYFGRGSSSQPQGENQYARGKGPSGWGTLLVLLIMFTCMLYFLAFCLGLLSGFFDASHPSWGYVRSTPFGTPAKIVFFTFGLGYLLGKFLGTPL